MINNTTNDENRTLELSDGKPLSEKEETSIAFIANETFQINSIERIIFQKRVKDKWLKQRKKAQLDINTESIELELLKNEHLKDQFTQTEQEQQIAVPVLPTSASSSPPPPPQSTPILDKKSFFTRLNEFYRNFSINPLNLPYYLWLITVTICFLYNAVFLIARSAFWLLQEIDYPIIWFILDYLICDFIYLLDILVRFSTSYMENGELCRNRSKIAKRYINKLQFKIDILSILPIDLIYLSWRFSPKIIEPKLNDRILPALRLNRLLKFSRVIEFRNITETETKYPTIFRLCVLLINILIAMHWNACIYFIISNFLGFGTDSWVFPALTSPDHIKNLTETELNNMLLTHRLEVQYIFCFWWSVQTLTTIAEVQQPTNYYQEIYMSVLLMIGVIILAITIGSASEMVENAQRQNLELQTKCDYAKSFMKQNKITGDLISRVKTYLDYLWIAKDVNQADVLNALPANLRKALAKNVHMETLKRVHVFQDCEPGLLEELVTKLKLQIYSPGDYVCRKGDVGHEMYFIKTGKLQVVSPDGTKVFATLVAGAAFGEISILDIPGNKNGNKRTANIRSLGFSNVYQLSKTDLWAALSEYPVAKKSLLEKGKALLRKDNLLDESIAEKLERKQKPLHEQVEHLQRNCLDKLNQKLDDIFKEYMEFLRETKISLAIMEKNFNFKKT